MRLSLAEVLEATGGGVLGGTVVAGAFESFHTDSREVVPGGLFFALRGATQDGHRFVPDACLRGAAGAVVDRRLELPHGVAQVVVADTWKSLYDLARLVRTRVDPLVVGVTGSNGKTSTKELAAAVLGVRHRVTKTEGNLNTETGVPLTMLRLQAGDTALVLEMGMQARGEIERLAALARPRAGLITGIGSVHMEFFDSQADLARAKAELVQALPADGRAILNADDEFSALLTRLSAAPVTTFGLDAGDVRGVRYRPLAEGGSSMFVDGVEVRLRLSGRHQARNAVAALALGGWAGVPIAEAAPALAEVRIGQRLLETASPAGFVVVDDSYNASPESMLAAFETMAERPRRGRMLAVLGEMRELGSLAVEAHRRIGKRAGEVFDAVCVVNAGHGRVLAAAAGAVLVADKAAAEHWVRDNAEPGSLVLVKASHGVALDELVASLLKTHPPPAGEG